MTEDMVLRELQTGPATAAELAGRHGHLEAEVRNTLSVLVFQRKCVTCDRQGRYRIGDPAPIIAMAG